jgi:hypothetical protein
MPEMLFKCKMCGKKAIWMYMPGADDAVYCDNCVPRGCSCNLEIKDPLGDWADPENYYQPLDEKGRLKPCCEYFLIDD